MRVERHRLTIPNERAADIDAQPPGELEARTFHGQTDKDILHDSRERRTGLSPRAVKGDRAAVVRGQRLHRGGLGLLEALLHRLQLLALTHQLLTVGQHIVEGRSVLEHQLVEGVEPGLHLLELAGISPRLVDQSLDLAHHLLDLDSGLDQPLGTAIENQPAVGDL